MHVALHHQEAFHRTQGKVTWQGLLKQFFIGGFIVSIVSYLCSHVSTKLAALVYSLPLTYLPVVFFVQNSAEKKGCPNVLTEYTGQNFASMVLMLIFGLALYLLLKAHALKRPSAYISGRLFSAYIFISLLCMGLPMLFYYYWVCSGSCVNGQFQMRTKPCYFG